jgi:hypothetical protein
MIDTMTSHNIDLPSWDTLYIRRALNYIFLGFPASITFTYLMVLLVIISMDFLLHVSTYNLGHHQAPSMISNPSY